ncbi:hypothetical protein D918_05568 [Trichuris suis]|nr:hypothetical protein D918_05568 [Trichuris suis]
MKQKVAAIRQMRARKSRMQTIIRVRNLRESVDK